MSYMLPANPGGSYSGGESYQWFRNAFMELRIKNAERITEVFKREYGYRIVNISSPDGEVSRRFVEFPNEAEATLFVLRWS